MLELMEAYESLLFSFLISWAFTSVPVQNIPFFSFSPGLKSFPSLDCRSPFYLSLYQLSLYLSILLVEHRWLNPPHSPNTSSSPPTLFYQIMHTRNMTNIPATLPSSSPPAHGMRTNNISRIGWSFSAWPWLSLLTLRLNDLNGCYQNQFESPLSICHHRFIQP